LGTPPGFTLDTYGYVMSGMEEAAADLVAGLIFG
jgi:hypothetical protein